uniref:Uncharacterized protein n=1 Tax=viral metagenome TaxID=1070528 RepID=A0A6C0C4R9_9ZZZZ
MNKFILYFVAIVLGIFVANILKDVCGCNNLVEGQCATDDPDKGADDVCIWDFSTIIPTSEKHRFDSECNEIIDEQCIGNACDTNEEKATTLNNYCTSEPNDNCCIWNYSIDPTPPRWTVNSLDACNKGPAGSTCVWNSDPTLRNLSDWTGCTRDVMPKNQHDRANYCLNRGQRSPCCKWTTPAAEAASNEAAILIAAARAAASAATGENEGIEIPDEEEAEEPVGCGSGCANPIANPDQNATWSTGTRGSQPQQCSDLKQSSEYACEAFCQIHHDLLGNRNYCQGCCIEATQPGASAGAPPPPPPPGCLP